MALIRLRTIRELDSVLREHQGIKGVVLTTGTLTGPARAACGNRPIEYFEGSALARKFQSRQFDWLCGVVVASDGSVYVADSNNHRIQKLTSAGGFVYEWGTQGSGEEEFYRPTGVAVAPDSSAYVGEVNHRIQKFSVGP